MTQALGFGVPAVVADDEPHAPEIALLGPGENGAFFRARDAAALATVLKDLWFDRDSWFNRSGEISAQVRREYSTEAMVDGFLRAIDTARNQ